MAPVVCQPVFQERGFISGVRWPFECNQAARAHGYREEEIRKEPKEVTLLSKNTATADLDATFKAIMLLLAFEVSLSKHSCTHADWICRSLMQVRMILELDHGASIWMEEL